MKKKILSTSLVTPYFLEEFTLLMHTPVMKQ